MLADNGRKRLPENNRQKKESDRGSLSTYLIVNLTVAKANISFSNNNNIFVVFHVLLISND